MDLQAILDGSSSSSSSSSSSDDDGIGGGGGGGGGDGDSSLSSNANKPKKSSSSAIVVPKTTRGGAVTTPRLDYTHYNDHYNSHNNNNKKRSMTTSVSTVSRSAYSSITAPVDLEQILREDDDDDDDDDGDATGMDRPWMTTTTAAADNNNNAYTSNASSSSSGNNNNHNTPEDWDVLQAILGEDDDDDDDDDDDILMMGGGGAGTMAFASSRAIVSGDDDDDDDDEWNVPAVAPPSSSTPSSSAKFKRHNLVDTILQQQSEEDDFDTMMQMMNNKNNSTRSASQRFYYSATEADLAGSIDNDEYDDDNDRVLESRKRVLTPPPPIVTNSSHNNNKNGGEEQSFQEAAEEEITITDSFVTAAQSVTAVRSGESSLGDGANASSTTTAAAAAADGILSVPSAGDRSNNSSSSINRATHGSRSIGLSLTAGTTTTTTGTTTFGKKPNSASSSSTPPPTELIEVCSRKALKFAQSYERKLLRSGHRDIVSPLMVKRRLKPKIELGTKQQQQQQNQNQQHGTMATPKSVTTTTTAAAAAAAAIGTPRGVAFFGFSGVVENKRMGGVSKRLMEAAATTTTTTSNNKTPDLPTALAVNSRFLAVGTQKGFVQVFDLFEVLRQRLPPPKLEAHPKRPTAGAVTSMDLSTIQGELLCVGHASGLIVLWDTIKGIALRTVIETVTPSPITAIRFFSDLKLVSVDAGGLVHKLQFSKNILFSNYSVEQECLLDGTAGQILAMNVLRVRPDKNNNKGTNTNSNSRSSSKQPNANNIVLIALSSERSSFAVAVEPSVHVLHRWARPPPEKVEPTDQNQQQPQQQVYLPCLSWGWALVSGGGHQVVPILARAWGCCLQLLRANFPEDNPDDTMMPAGGGGGGVQWPAFGVHDEFQVVAPVVAMEWLNDRSLVYLTINNEFTVVDTVMMTLLERLDFSGLKLVFAEFSLSRKVVATATNENGAATSTETVPTYCTTFQNSVRSCDDRLLLLCQEELTSVSIVGAKQRISAREQDGEWLEALALALDHYENTISSQQDRRRVRDLSKHPEYSHGNQISEDEEWIAKMLIRYLNTAVENAPEMTSLMATPATMNSNASKEWMQSQLELAQSHFQMLAGVCVEFCVVTKRLDLLFGPIFRRFQVVGFLHVFLDVLEPYVLNDKLDYIAPEAMAHFVEHCRATNGIATVERCLLHMDVTIMDFDSILSLLRANEMYSALFYVFNQGLDDYTTPLEILLEKVFDVADMVGTKQIGLEHNRRPDGVPQNDFERYGYKAILYLQNCFRGHTFPQDVPMSEERLKMARPQLLRFLLQKEFSPSRSVKTPAQIFGLRAVPYPYAHILLMVDPKVMFDTISIAMNAPDSDFARDDAGALLESIGGWQVEVSGGGSSSVTGEGGDGGMSQQINMNQAPHRQEIISMFSAIIIPDEDDIATTRQTTLYRSSVAVNSFLDFLAEYLMKGVIRANRSVTLMILNRMANRFAEARDPQDRINSQKQILQLLTALPRNAYDPEEVLELVQRAGIHRAALLLHQEGASVWAHGSTTVQRRAEHFIAAIDCYLDDDDLEFRKEVFAYVKKECSAVSEEGGGRGGESQPDALRDGLTSKLAELIHLDALMSAELVAELFVEDLDRVIRSLQDDEEAQFMFFQAVISGELIEMDQVSGGVLNAHLTMEHHHKYLGLMAKLHPELVYDYLSSHDNYRPGECLKLCQKYEIADASAYLLERMGNVSSALQLILQTLESRMMGLKRTIRGMGSDFFTKYSATSMATSSRGGNRRGGKTKGLGPLPGLYGKQEQEINGVKRILVVALDVCERNSGSFSSRTEHGSQLWFNVLDRLINAKGFLRLSKEQVGHAKVMAGVLSELLRLTMQRMVSSVPLPDLVRKVTSDHSGSRLGELREMIEILLSTYGLELNVFSGAVEVFHYDSQQMQKQHRAFRIRGAVVHSIMNTPFSSAESSNNALAIEGGSPDSSNILQLSETGHASFVDRDGRARSQHAAEQGFGNSIARLRARRRGGIGQNTSSRPMDRCRATGLNFMTSNDLSLRQGQVSPDVTYFEDRVGGALGDAEHRGRLMSFMY